MQAEAVPSALLGQQLFQSRGLMRPREQQSSACSYACWRGRRSIYQDPRSLSSPPASNWTLLAFAGLRGRQQPDLLRPVSQAQAGDCRKREQIPAGGRGSQQQSEGTP